MSASNWETDEGEEDSGPYLTRKHRRAGNVYARVRRTTLIPSRRARLAPRGPGGRSKCSSTEIGVHADDHA